MCSSYAQPLQHVHKSGEQQELKVVGAQSGQYRTYSYERSSDAFALWVCRRGYQNARNRQGYALRLAGRKQLTTVDRIMI